MERDATANAPSVIDESDHQRLNAEAFADMAMSHIDMNLALHSLEVNKSYALSPVIETPESPPKLSAYEELKDGVVHYSRREDKIRALQRHPIVASVSADGRTVDCKCGRSVRLNPPWYILKFEQHVASRNCTVLRQNRHVKRKRNNDLDTKEDKVERSYSLQSVDVILHREFGAILNGEPRIQPPDASSQYRRQMYQCALALRGNPHCKRMTPDGKFVECQCSRIILLGTPWQPGQFLLHVAEKQKPTKRAKVALMAEWRKKKGLNTIMALDKNILATNGSIQFSSCVNKRFPAYKRKPSFPRDIQWDVARARGLLPCPGLRDERMNTFVSSAIQLTGGARNRQKIARELFPHLFINCFEDDSVSMIGHGAEVDSCDESYQTKRQFKRHQELLEAEKLLLHDVVEGEALWFVDKDGNSVRSLDCLGVIDSNAAEVRCTSCTALRSNAALRTAAAAQYKMATRSGRPRNPINRKFCSGRVCSLLETEFDMQEPYAKVLRDLALAEIPSALNTWMEMASMGLSGEFETHAVLLGLIEAMVRLKDKEQRGVGLQNMMYSDHLDAFMQSLDALSSEAYELFQRHLGGRKQKQLVAATLKRSKRKIQSVTMKASQDQLPRGSDDDGIYSSNGGPMTGPDRFEHLLDPLISGLSERQLSINDIQDVDLVTFPTLSTQLRLQSSNKEDVGSTSSFVAKDADTAMPSELDSPDCPERGNNVETARIAEERILKNPCAVAFLSESPSCSTCKTSSNREIAIMPTDHVPCTGLRDENVQAYVSNAVQIVGGSRPRYVIARELFPRVFGNDKKVRIVDKLSEEQRQVLQDAVFSECLWRVDKEGRCVRSLRCKRFVPATDTSNRASLQSHGVCRACRDLRTVPNFRSVLSRSKVPKKLENIKYVPSVYTESDPFLRKLSKNAAFRGLYQTVKRMVSHKKSEMDATRRKQVHFWLRFARMGVFGHFQSHPVFEGLIKSMVEMKDKERRGVGKQNMQYSRALDAFMQSIAQRSTEAFELFASHFCGRTLRSQKIKGQSTLCRARALSDSELTTRELPLMLSAPQEPQFLIPSDDILSGRSLSSEESQCFMDRMLDEVRLSSVDTEMQLAGENDHRRGIEKADDVLLRSTANDEDDPSRLSPESYLDDVEMLTTEV
ncbi:hypothetical protein CCR75_005370 [Bremia lactucae]|uniref:Uncharacterized protein n=1 Tax=Bremia lactucae TaxID=4779 RepID=A0A976FF81_BRELC|nr:hypothetical protein CCR75_005370 [Bremia lactucae]